MTGPEKKKRVFDGVGNCTYCAGTFLPDNKYDPRFGVYFKINAIHEKPVAGGKTSADIYERFSKKKGSKRRR